MPACRSGRMSSKERSMHDPGHHQGEYVQHGLHIMQSMQSSSYFAVLAKIPSLQSIQYVPNKLLKQSVLKRKGLPQVCKMAFNWILECWNCVGFFSQLNFLEDLSFKVISGIQIAIKRLFYQISLQSATKWLIRWPILYKRGEGAQGTVCALRARVTRIMGRFPDLERKSLIRNAPSSRHGTGPGDSLIQSKGLCFFLSKRAK